MSHLREETIEGHTNTVAGGVLEATLCKLTVGTESFAKRTGTILN